MNNTTLQECYGTLSETLNALMAESYTVDFNIPEDCDICHRDNIHLYPQEFQIDKVYRFEGETNPEDQSILYAISSIKYNVKGVLVNGYGIASDEKAAELIALLDTPNAAV